jgi:hypothetical protein
MNNYNKKTDQNFDESMSLLSIVTAKSQKIKVNNKINNEEMKKVIISSLKRKGMKFKYL